MINNPNAAFGYAVTSGGDTESGEYLVSTTVTKGNLVQISAATPTAGVIPALTNGDTPAIVGIALANGAPGETIVVVKGGYVDAVKDATVVVTAGDVVLRSATTVGQIISAAAASTLPGANLGYVIVGATAVAGTVRIHYNQV